jgi:cyclic-di-AMP phosphodiesterase PgpH
MFTILLKLKRRIKRLLKAQTGSRQETQQTARSVVVRYLMLAIAAVLIGLLYPGRLQFGPLDMPRAGSVAVEDITAPFQITMLKTQHEMNTERDQAMAQVPPVVDDDTVITMLVYAGLRGYVAVADSLRALLARSVLTVREAADSLSARYKNLSRETIERSLLSTTNLPAVLADLQSVYANDIYVIGVLESIGNLPETRNKTVIVRRGPKESLIQRSRLLDMALANARLSTALNRMAAVNPMDVEYHFLVGRGFMLPNLRVNVAEYRRRLEEDLSLVSNVREVVNSGELIVKAQERVTERQASILAEMNRLQQQTAIRQGWYFAVIPYVSRILLVLAVLGTLYLFLYYFRRETFLSNPKLMAMFTVLGIQLFLMYLADLTGLTSNYIYPVALFPVMITILFDAEIGLFATIVFALLLGITHRFDFSLSLMTVTVGAVASLASRNVRRRGHFYRTMFLVVAASVGFVLIVESLRVNPSDDLLSEILYGAMASIVGVMLSIGFLPVIESIFSITTDVTLLELSDLNHPILKRLSFEAPGTYHHSIQVGNLSETAAKAIGANSLLARVGSYYHDIGKIEIPEYFVENQLGIKSRHEGLSPSMSAMVLSSHVKKGRQLGEDADIPDDVLNFIEEHHGTLVMTYFYNKAVEQGADPAVVEKFRYPGPRPQIRETGIAMLADAVEAASRTLDDPKPARIDALIQRIINDRFQSGELDECPLTLRELAKIKEAFKHVLVASFHQRVRYPKRDGGV